MPRVSDERLMQIMDFWRETESADLALDLRDARATIAAVRRHAADFQDADGESAILGILDCPHHEPLHYHHDGCPACETAQPFRDDGATTPEGSET